MAEANPRVFDLFDPTEAVVAAEAVVKLPRDRNSLFQMSKLEEKIDRTANSDEVVELEKKVAELKAKVDESALRVTLRGIDKTAIDAIMELVNSMVANPEHPLTEADKDDFFHVKVMESMIVKIVDFKDNEFGHPGDRTKEWYDTQPPENRIALNAAVKDLSFSAYQYDADTVNPDFSQTY